MKKWLYVMFLITFTQGCQTVQPIPISQTQPFINDTILNSTIIESSLTYTPNRIQPKDDELLQVQRINNQYCNPEQDGYLPNVTYTLSKTGVLSHGYGNSISIEASDPDNMKLIQLTKEEFDNLKLLINNVQQALDKNPPVGFNIKSPILNPPTYKAGECAIFEAFNFTSADNKRVIYERPDFELYEAPLEIYSQEYTQALDQLKDRLFELRSKYSNVDSNEA